MKSGKKRTQKTINKTKKEIIGKNKIYKSNEKSPSKGDIHRISVDGINKKIEALALEALNKSSAPGVIIECAQFGEKRRKRSFWSINEENDLRIGVSRHGQKWAKILSDVDLDFNNRTQIDLKDKWRNMQRYVAYAQRPLRHYRLLDQYHNPILTASGNPHIYTNRWPRDAATKVATKSEFYPEGSKSILIFLKEISPANGLLDDNEPDFIVHVYKGTRVAQSAANIEKFKGARTMWVGKVTKVREEVYIKRADIEK